MGRRLSNRSGRKWGRGLLVKRRSRRWDLRLFAFFLLPGCRAHVIERFPGRTKAPRVTCSATFRLAFGALPRLPSHSLPSTTGAAMSLNLTASKVVLPVASQAPKAVVPQPRVNQVRAAPVNASSARQMLTWTPTNNKFFETLSFLPPLSEEEIAKQVVYIVSNGWTPCLEFANPTEAYVNSENCVRLGSVSSNYVDNRYWTMWKLPMFGCTDPSQVQAEIQACIKTFPDAYLRIVGFDSVRQVQVAGFLVHRPPNSTEFQAPGERSVGP